VVATAADIAALERDVGFRPTTPVGEGVRRFVEWYRAYYGG
jgi:UDP-glucuronate 4-epimerase